MAKIIRFPVQSSNGYKNFSELIQITGSKAALNFYIECIETAEKQGHFLEGEAEKLMEQGRKKRLEMARPEQTKKEVIQPGVYYYTPEMGQQKPDCQMEASRGYYGKHWFIDTPLEIKGRGITFLKKYQEKDFCNSEDHRVGWNGYRVTNKAFEILKTKYSISQECLLD